MKRFIAITAIAFLSLPSCSKIRDQIKHHPEDIGKCCRIESATAYLGQSFQRFDFTYDSSGNPVSMIAQNPAGYQYINTHMHYDENGRLKVYNGDGFGGTMWHSFTYPSPDTIVDWYAYDPDPSSYLSTTTITLDDKGRAVRYSTASEGQIPPPDVTEVSYDRNDNAIIPGVTYDDKINPLQTNKILQLLGRDYSRNNQIVSTGGGRMSPSAYNQYGLPTKFEAPATFMRYLLFLWDGYDSLSIRYSCDADGAK
jgi:hypothetical protein